MSEYKQYSCKHCNQKFLGRTRDRKKGKAIFCSRTCSDAGNKARHVHYEKVCRNCGKDFLANSVNAKYCSSMCSTKYSKRIRSVDRRKGIFKKIAELPCEICGYDSASRDVHHIKPVSQGGDNTGFNLISLCPNCHRECHEMHFSETVLRSLAKKRMTFLFNLDFSDS